VYLWVLMGCWQGFTPSEKGNFFAPPCLSASQLTLPWLMFITHPSVYSSAGTQSLFVNHSYIILLATVKVVGLILPCSFNFNWKHLCIVSLLYVFISTEHHKTHLSDLRFSQRWRWRYYFSGLWCYWDSQVDFRETHCLHLHESKQRHNP
jgi:hypothetical protein